MAQTAGWIAHADNIRIQAGRKAERVLGPSMALGHDGSLVWQKRAVRGDTATWMLYYLPETLHPWLVVEFCFPIGRWAVPSGGHQRRFNTLDSALAYLALVCNGTGEQ